MILRKARPSEANDIWVILQQAIEQRRKDGSGQWQNGYPNEQVVQDDIAKGHAYVLADKDVIIAYAAIIFEREPAYDHIDGKWLSDGDYVVVHRVATSDAAKGRGVAATLFEMLENLCLEKKVYSIKVDTIHDNFRMMKLLDKLHYTYCGQIFFQNAWCRAYEKVLH
ncbi:MAG TPA: GNAT family N-acetyltransferase [Cyclobacteriaceae bacterium]|jgi:GNAT superfamily N-acetyltransferase|nr:GNAT family N-acetyltransferase [Cyclobacteriaceae bacterium]